MDIKLIIAAIGLGLVVLGTAWVTHKVDNSAYTALELGYQKALADAVAQTAEVQAAQDKIGHDVDVAEASAQQKIVTQTNVVTKEVIVHVPIASKCPVTVGFVRVLNAAILGSGPSDLSYSPGQSDDACASTDARTLAGSIVANYGNSLANSQQLDSLQKWVTGVIEASKPKK